MNPASSFCEDDRWDSSLLEKLNALAKNEASDESELFPIELNVAVSNLDS